MKEPAIRIVALQVWIFIGVLGVALLPLWKVAGSPTCCCAAHGAAIAAHGSDEMLEADAGEPAAASCCALAALDDGADAPAPEGPERPDRPGRCDCPDCACSMHLIPIAIASVPEFRFPETSVGYVAGARVFVPQLAGADLFHPPTV